MTVSLHRRDLSVLFEDEKGVSDGLVESLEVAGEEEEKAETKKKTMPWMQKNAKKGKKAGSKKSGGKKPSAPAKKETDDKKKAAVPKSKESVAEENGSGSEGEDDLEEEDSDEPEEVEGEKSGNEGSEPEKDDDQLEKLRNDVALRRQRLLEGKSQISHSVHCPYFPQDKQEYWWAYITDRKNQLLLTSPYHITNLVEREEIQLKFTAPFKPGLYTFAVCLRSDSYFGFDLMKDIKVRTEFHVTIYKTCFFHPSSQSL